MSLRIVIIGAGEVGFNLAKELSREDHDITVVDNKAEKVKRASETLDVNTLEGNGASPFILRSAQVDRADIFLALTRIDEVNLVASQMAKKLGARTVIARLRNTEYTSPKAIIEPAQFGIDEVIHPELAAVEEVERLLRQSSATDVKEFEAGRLQLVGVLLEPSSVLVDRTVADVSSARNAAPHMVIAIDRGGNHFTPRSSTTYQAGDIVYVLAEAGHASRIVTMLGKPSREVKRVMILGAGKIGRNLASRLQDDLDVKLVDANKSKAWEIAPSLTETLVLHGDWDPNGNGGTDVQLISVTVTDDNDDPLITSSAIPSVAENQTVVLTVTTTDEDVPADTITFSLTGGADQAKFSINATTGDLTFNTAPDFEKPTGKGRSSGPREPLSSERNCRAAELIDFATWE